MSTFSKAAQAELAALARRHGADPERIAADLGAQARERTLAAGERLLEAGAQARLAGIVVDGLLGEFYESPGGVRKTKWLAQRGDVCGSLEDLVREAPARASIEALAPSRVIVLPYALIRRLATTTLPWAQLYVSMLEELYRKKSEREYTLLMLKAGARYEWFRRQFGDLERHLSQEAVASYLGITPVHLSRVRAARRG